MSLDVSLLAPTGVVRRFPTFLHRSVGFLQSFLRVLRPAVFTRCTAKLSPTAYLDGLRGFAAFLVYWTHHQSTAHTGPEHDIFDNGYGYRGRYYCAALPIIRMFFTGGNMAVAVFFVISGYVLSRRHLSLIQAGEQTRFYESLASAVFRRWARLFIPCAATTFIFAASWHMFGLSTKWPPHQPTFLAEMWRWLVEFKNWSFLWAGSDFFSYNLHLWSIPVELRGSFTVYTTHLALSKCSRDARLYIVAGLIIYFLYIVDGWSYSLFLGGLLLCELHLLADSGDLPELFYSPIFKRHRKLIAYGLFAISMLLAGVPSSSTDIAVLRDTPVWSYLSFLAPPVISEFKWFYLFWAATFLVASVPNISWLKGFFETPFCQYLGHISFALYLVHGPLLETIGERIYLAVGFQREGVAEDLAPWVNAFPLPNIGPYGLELNYLLSNMILLPITLWFAEVVTTLFDGPAVSIPRWLYKTVEAPPRV
jgi:peptidoglycan/LPS O-acetylase OafA/YrhL